MENENHIVSLIANIRDKSNKLIMLELEKKSIFDLAPSHGNILQLLFNSKELLTMQDIATNINRDKSTITALISKLLKLGYIKKLKSEEDSRKTIIVLTKKGWELEPIFEQISQKLLDVVYKGFSDQDKKEVISALIKIEKNL